MNWEAIGAIGEAGGTVLIIVSLLFLAFQVRQNTQQLQEDNLLKTIRGTLDTNWAYHRDPQVLDLVSRGCRSFDSLSREDQAYFHSLVMDLSFYLEVVARMGRAGLMDPSAVEINQRFFLAILDSPGGQEWWRVARATRPMPEDALAYLDGVLADPKRKRFDIFELQPWLRPEGF
jgi:hypothetical protein